MYLSDTGAGSESGSGLGSSFTTAWVAASRNSLGSSLKSQTVRNAGQQIVASLKGNKILIRKSPLEQKTKRFVELQGI